MEKKMLAKHLSQRLYDPFNKIVMNEAKHEEENMPSYLSGTLIKLTRGRKKMQQNMLHSNQNISLVENLIQNPSSAFNNDKLTKLGMPVETHFYFLSEKYTPKIFENQDQIMYLLDSKVSTDWQKARGLINELSQIEGFDTEIEKQLIICWKAQLNELMCLVSPADNMIFIKKGLVLTYEKFDHREFEGDMLIFAEPKLLHTYALALARDGKASDAIALLYHVQEGINLLPEDDQDKEKQLAPILLSLSDLLISEKKYIEALDICLKGNSVSTKRNEGKYMPDFLYNMAICNGHMGNAIKCRQLFQQSYFCYTTMRKIFQMEQVRNRAKEFFEVEFETYGAENLAIEEISTIVRHGASVNADHKIGHFIAIIRNDEGLSQKALSNGICDQSTLKRIESGELQGNIHCLEAIMQRLGRDINKYFATFPSVEDFRDKQIRNNIISKLASLDFESAVELLEKLRKDKKSYESGVGLQFIKMSDATVFASRHEKGYASIEYFDMLMESLKITIPQFNEAKVTDYRLSYYEFNVVNLKQKQKNS